jgi:sphingomyelin phosphodiesterase acid-like 3
MPTRETRKPAATPPATLIPSQSATQRPRMKTLLTLLLLAAALPAASQTVPVLMLSDIHLDPYHDPAKLPHLRAAPVTEWAAILNAPPSATQAADFAHLQSTCGARGVDTPPLLLESSLAAEKHQQPHPLFVTVSGDLMAHQFDCRFHTLAPTATPADYSAFAAKTIAYVALRLRETFPATPIYLALGNNDSGCHDYQEDPNSAFLQSDGTAFAAATLTPSNAAAIKREFSQFGDYNVALPAPFHHTRLIVLQDIFESSRYATCSGEAPLGNRTPSELQVDWLRTQLTAARAAHQKVWVMAHIPPGIDPYSTVKQAHGVSCPAAPPTYFIPSTQLPNTLAQFADIIKLALFGHTHMDEIRVYPSATLGPQGTTASIVPAKLVPSITPVNGNNPAFTLADVDPATATLNDYTVFSASNQTGLDTAWTQEYRYSTTYNLPDFSGPSAAKLSATFLADTAGTTAASQAYQRFYFVGDPGLSINLKAAAMQLVWHTYACSIAHFDDTAFRTCVCPSAP